MFLLSDLLVAVFVDIQQKAGKIVTDIRNNRKLEHSYVYCYVVGPYLHSSSSYLLSVFIFIII